jgi:hypothetical protein
MYKKFFMTTQQTQIMPIIWNVGEAQHLYLEIIERLIPDRILIEKIGDDVGKIIKSAGITRMEFSEETTFNNLQGGVVPGIVAFSGDSNFLTKCKDILKEELKGVVLHERRVEDGKKRILVILYPHQFFCIVVKSEF